jgi:phosphoglycerate kinase
LLDKDVEFIGDFKNQKDKIASLNDSKVALIDNIRFYSGETKNDETLSKELSSLCDVYVNDAFGSSHRKHSSTYGIAEFSDVKVAGLLLKKEIDAFSQALGNPARPLLLIIGGAKVSSKLTLLKSILNVVDKIIIGGAMSNTFLKALGYNVQDSLVEDELLYESLQILESAKHKNVKIYLPVDVVCTDDLNMMNDIKVVPVQDIPKGYMTADIGPATLRLFREVVSACDTIVWNGPMGVFEKQKFSRGTFRLAHYIDDSYAFSLVGGGDTADAVEKASESDNMSFISTGGGASLELLEGKVLPSFEVLDKR